MAWRMWWLGYDIPTSLIRELLRPLSVEVDAKLIAMRSTSSSDIEAIVGSIAQEPVHGSFMRGVRQRTGVEYERFIELVVGIARSDSSSWSSEDLELFERGFGLRRARTDWVAGGDVILSSAKTIVDAAHRAMNTDFTELLGDLSDDELVDGRDLLVLHVEFLRSFGRMLERFVAPRAFGLTSVAAGLEGMSPEDEAILLMAGLTLIRAADVDPALLEMERRWLNNGARALDAFQGLLDAVPALAGIMSRRRFGASIRFPNARLQMESALRETYRTHTDEIEAYKLEHPEVERATFE